MADTYQYTPGFSLLTSWVIAANEDSNGLTTDGSNIWIVDNGTSKEVCKYNIDGTLPDEPPPRCFSLSPKNHDATGITTDGNNIWVVDEKVGNVKVYKYTTGGDIDGEFALTGDNQDPTGITTDGSNIWVVDKSDDKVYKYDMSGNFDSSFSLIAANADPEGITVTPREFGN